MNFFKRRFKTSLIKRSSCESEAVAFVLKFLIILFSNNYKF